MSSRARPLALLAHQYLCQKQCGSDDPCARACVEAYKQCIGACDKAR
jgi:hypothetical protein